MTRVPPFMGDFSDEDLAWAMAVGEKRRVPAGEAIIREGEPVHDLFVILEGGFLVTSQQLRVPVVRRLGRGEIAGEMTYVFGGLPLSSVRAEVDSVVLCIPRTALDEKIATDAGFAARFHRVVSEFAVDRLYGWAPPDARGQASPAEPQGDSLRVYELIEKMLRGDFP